ncbi:MAG TPA: hypothetical protein VLZ74_15215 [Methylocella sp.]|nr:hypothetical protein [Methylocella sp.]
MPEDQPTAGAHAEAEPGEITADAAQDMSSAVIEARVSTAFQIEGDGIPHNDEDREKA